MARKSKYIGPILSSLTREYVSTNYVRKTMMAKNGKAIHWLQISSILNKLLLDGKVQKKEITLEKEKIFMWRIAKEKTLKS